MSNLRDAAQAALDALQRAEVEMRYAGWRYEQSGNTGRFDAYISVLAAMAGLEAALAADKAQDAQPVAWIFELKAGEYAFCRVADAEANKRLLTAANHAKALYTHPPEDAKDAARYREIRKRGAFLYPNGDTGFDAAIDGFMKEQPCPDCGKTTAPDTIHTCSPQVRELSVAEIEDVFYNGAWDRKSDHYVNFARAIIAAAKGEK